MSAQTPQCTNSGRYRDLRNIRSAGPVKQPEFPRRHVADYLARTTELAVAAHYNIRRTVDIFGSVRGTDLAVPSGAAMNARSSKTTSGSCPEARKSAIRGRIGRAIRSSCRSSVGGSLAPSFFVLTHRRDTQSWLDPFIIITATPGGTQDRPDVVHDARPLDVPALTGAIMCMGVATADSIPGCQFRQGSAPRSRQSPRGRASRPDPPDSDRSLTQFSP